MKVILAVGHALCLIGGMSVRMAAFVLWSAIAAGAGWMLAHLPDVWNRHIADQSSTNFAVAAVIAYTVVAGALFLEFSCGVLQMLADAYKEIRLLARKRRSRDAAFAIQRRQPLFIRMVGPGRLRATSPIRGGGKSTPPPATAGMPARQRATRAEAASASSRTHRRPM